MDGFFSDDGEVGVSDVDGVVGAYPIGERLCRDKPFNITPIKPIKSDREAIFHVGLAPVGGINREALLATTTTISQRQ